MVGLLVLCWQISNAKVLLHLLVIQDEDRLQTATNEAPTLESFNRQLARSSAEFDLFQRLDREAWWPGELFNPQEVRYF